MIRANLKQTSAISWNRAGVLKNNTTRRRGFTAALLCAAVLLFGYPWIGHTAGAQNAQSGETFKARLSPVPIDVTMLSTIAGSGSLTAVLAGKRFTLTGTFEGLRSPATTAQIHRGPKGIRGPAILDLTVSKAEKGAVSGSFELTPEQIADLKNGRWYVQIQSERAPDGNLWGWLLQ
jgi:CHRD domain